MSRMAFRTVSTPVAKMKASASGLLNSFMEGRAYIATMGKIKVMVARAGPPKSSMKLKMLGL